MNHRYAKNPKVMTESECLQYARENLREGISEIYVVRSETTDSALENAMRSYYFANPYFAFDSEEVVYDSVCVDRNSACGWSYFGALFYNNSFGNTLLHSDTAKALDYYLGKFKRIGGEKPVGDFELTFIVSLSPDNQKPNQTVDDINKLYDTWHGKCRMIVVITNPQESWGLKHGRRVVYKLSLNTFEDEEHKPKVMVQPSFKFPWKR